MAPAGEILVRNNCAAVWESEEFDGGEDGQDRADLHAGASFEGEEGLVGEAGFEVADLFGDSDFQVADLGADPGDVAAHM